MSLRKNAVQLLLLLNAFAAPLLADTVILQSGASYTGTFEGARRNEIAFTDNQGVQYTFPLSDVQSLVFTGSTDVISLRSGKVYSGQYTGSYSHR